MWDDRDGQINLKPTIDIFALRFNQYKIDPAAPPRCRYRKTNDRFMKSKRMQI